ncbi:chemotaxis protein CheW [Fulvimarina sp. 2208YS6-2-32]|uniref:Chemotaxis protein CheW n=1 Tax=Fulvimarina uroteuthidis TaxID=3098149 RepID=A0ABU5HXC2_9HYPH|nr:chemotaxis protein CheW [Fulvimarina sp. 2208YS6-2-32]MDY8107621.1 chemotaxis protein CheW [Fulvimarina sp. 2208YS6-2-32]
MADTDSDDQIHGRDYLTIALDDDIFAMRVGSVHEVLDPPVMTRVPNAPSHAPGLINVRGNVMPLVDLRKRFDMDEREDGETTRVIVTEVERLGETYFVGLKADAVYEVLDIAPEAIQPLPENGTRWPRDLMSGVIQRDGRFVLLLDIANVVRGTGDANPQ